MPSTLKPMDQLPLKHQLYILGYLIHKGDKTKAARHAGYSARTAKEQGHQLFTKLHHYIDPQTRDLVRGHALQAEQVVQGLSLLGSSDIGEYLEWDHTKNQVILKDFKTLTPEQRYCIEGVEQKVNQWGQTIKLTLAKKQPALESLAQYHNLFRRAEKSKGLVVVFEDGTVHGGVPVKREALTLTRQAVEIVFEDAEPGPTMKGGNGHGKP